VVRSVRRCWERSLDVPCWERRYSCSLAEVGVYGGPDRKRTCIDDREEALRSGTWKLRKGRKKNDEAYHDCESKAKIMASWSAVDQHAQHEAAPPAMRG
jgi:hypothetical protein